jgi:hypothetical protein
MLGDAVRSMPDIARVLRERVRELGITFETLDDIAGVARGLSAKCLSDPPQKAMGARAMVLIAGALGVCFVPIVDHEQTVRVKDRWTKRKRQPTV